MGNYFREFVQRLGNGWNRFWFAPRDPIGLAVLRIGAGLLAVYTLLTYTPDLVRWFAEAGLLTPELAYQFRMVNETTFSYLEYLHLSAELYAVHAIAIIVALLFTVGLFTRITAVLTLLAMLSYIHRGSILDSEFEPLLCMVLFYLCLGPSGSALSLDAWRARRRAATPAFDEHRGPEMSWTATVATRLIQVHFAAAVLMMVLAKLRGDAWWVGEAVWWLAATPSAPLVDITAALRERPLVYNAWTHYVVAAELAFVVLVWNPLARPLALTAAWVAWLSLAPLTGNLSFAAALILASLAYISPEVWRGMLRASREDLTSETAERQGSRRRTPAPA